MPVYDLMVDEVHTAHYKIEAESREAALEAFNGDFEGVEYKSGEFQYVMEGSIYYIAEVNPETGDTIEDYHEIER